MNLDTSKSHAMVPANINDRHFFDVHNVSLNKLVVFCCFY